MRRTFYFTRLYTRAVEAQIPFDSVVSFHKHPHDQKVYTQYSSMDYSDDGVRRTYVSKYGYSLFINLWLVKMRLDWLGREQKQPR